MFYGFSVLVKNILQSKCPEVKCITPVSPEQLTVPVLCFLWEEPQCESAAVWSLGRSPQAVQWSWALPACDACRPPPSVPSWWWGLQKRPRPAQAGQRAGVLSAGRPPEPGPGWRHLQPVRVFYHRLGAGGEWWYVCVEQLEVKVQSLCFTAHFNFVVKKWSPLQMRTAPCGKSTLYCNFT